MAQRQAYVLGVGMTPFIKPRGERQYPELGFEAGVKAMLDAGITYDDVQAGVACYAYGGSTCGERVFYQFGLTGIPIYNTRNACATGSTGLHMARSMVRAGMHDCVLVIGFEQMAAGPLTQPQDGRPSPIALSTALMKENFGDHNAPENAQFFGNAGREYMQKYGASARDFAEIARISHEHSTRNPYSQFRQEYTLDQILDSPKIYDPLTKLQCSPTSDGAAAAIIVSEDYLKQHPGLERQAILMAGQALRTDDTSLFTGSAMDLVGVGMTREAAKIALQDAGRTIQDIKVCELHDCFSCNEMITLDGLGFCEPGKAHEMVRKGDITYGGRGPVINPSGGLISKGHPIGATGVAQCAELTWQLRGWAGERHVDTSAALQHNLGLGGCVVVTVYARADGAANKRLTESQVVQISNFGYNPATTAKHVTKADFEKVRSRKCSVEYALGDTMVKIQSRL